ncbi:MAG: ATP-grasp domain-containing protein [Pseudomonadota bacterium]
MTQLILVLDAAQRSALAVTRSLGRLPQLEVMTAEAATQALAGCSSFSQQFFTSPSPISAPEDYINWLENLNQHHNFALIVPVTEVTSQLLLMNMARLPKVRLPFASYENVLQLADKGNLMALAQALGIPIPATRLLASSANLAEVALNYPCVIKPCLSKIFTPSGWIATCVKIIHSPADLEKVLRSEIYLQEYPFMIQEFIPGNGAGIFCLYHHGQPTAFFAHRRLREKPPQGGVSVLSESAKVDPTLKLYAEKLLAAANWHGVAMVEFRIAPDGIAYLMEVNTRFWGSLQLAIDAGINFPALMISNELALGLPIPKSYTIGQRLRWVLGDVDSLYLYLKSTNSGWQKLRRIIEFLTPGFKTKHEINRVNDFRPALYELKVYIRQILGKK